MIITGGTGFIGQLVARAILQKGTLLVHQPSGDEAEAEVSEVVLADVARPPQLMFAELEDSSACTVRLGDISDPLFCRSLFDGALRPPCPARRDGARANHKQSTCCFAVSLAVRGKRTSCQAF